MINNYLTSEKYLENYNKGEETAVAKMNISQHIFVTEKDTTYPIVFDSEGQTHRIEHLVHYLVGPIADTLHAYEELGYTPDELKKIVKDHEEYKAVDLAIKKLRLNMLYGTTAFANSASRVMEEMREAQRMAEERRYIDTDIAVTQMIYDRTDYLKKAREVALLGDWVKKNSIKPDPKPTPAKPETKTNPAPVVERAIFNDPATIVFWKDGTKTVVKAQKGETYDPEKGLAMAFSKKMFGNEGNYYDQFTKLLPKEKK